ncbi:hypothetical protein BJY04DRAFT_205706 [Aspergillus karnatakaensis]|uniref:isopenicillin N synthase family dioxygenase n=1 Tax=Aspergillus karnatakaensis TaxID=1810916 RepID=UPI003CCD46A8
MTIPRAPPILDFSAFYGPNSDAKERLIQDVRAACLNNGFFQITGHRVPLEVQQRALSSSRQFFSMPTAEKSKLDKKNSKLGRGYEAVQCHQMEQGTLPDLKEDFMVGVEIPEDHPYQQQGKPGYGPNVWPVSTGLESPEQFRKSTMVYFEHVLALARDIVTVLALSLGLDEGYLDPLKSDIPIAVMKYLYYPQLPVGADLSVTRGFGAHTDFCPFAIVLQGEVSGLEVLEESTGEWVMIEPVPGAFVVNLGASFTQLTNGLYKSSVHRVINNRDSDRLSIPFFFIGNPNYVLRPLPKCPVLEKEESRAPLTVQEFVAAKVKGTYAQAEKTKDQQRLRHGEATKA